MEEDDDEEIVNYVDIHEDIRKCRRAEPGKYKENIELAFKFLETFHYEEVDEEEEFLQEMEKLDKQLKEIENDFKPLLKDFDIPLLLKPVIKVNLRKDLLSVDNECDCIDSFYEIDKEIEESSYQGAISLDELVDEGYAHYKDRMEDE